ncbi:MAG: deacetylase [Methylomonas sp.]|nr:MAG: deacetylase [Methylomonas sp.]
MPHLRHPFSFDPSYGFTLEQLLDIKPPDFPADFAQFWQRRYLQTLKTQPVFKLEPAYKQAGFRVFDVHYQSTDDFTIGGWLLEPEYQDVHQVIMVGHGYGGREQPDFHFNIPNTAFLFPCFRGISRSRSPRVSDQPHQHVLKDIADPQHYILGGCVDDLWLGVSLLHELYPAAKEQTGYMGISFGGGIGALALPWDKRIKRGHFNVPTFGCHPLRLALPTIGSGSAVTEYVQQLGHTPDTLTYYDAAVAATFAVQPIHIAAALFDPMVAPPGQFAIYNAWTGPKKLFVLDAGHFEYPGQSEQNQQLLGQLQMFFGDWSKSI